MNAKEARRTWRSEPALPNSIFCLPVGARSCRGRRGTAVPGRPIALRPDRRLEVGHAAETAQSAAFRPSARHAARTRRARRASPLHASVRRAGEGHAGASDRSGLARPRATPEGSRRTFGRRTTLPMCHAHLGSTARENHPSHSSM